MSVGNLHMLLSNTTALVEFELLRSTATVTEGGSFSITLNVTSKPSWANLDGRTYDYVIDGSGIDSSDISGASLNGSFTLSNDQAVLNINTAKNDDTLLFIGGPSGIIKYRIDRNLDAHILESSGGPNTSGQRLQSLFFRPDGSSMSFHIDTNSNTLHRSINLGGSPVPSANQWLIPNSSSGSVDLVFQAGGVGADREGLWISPNGTQYMTISRAQRRLYHRQMSIPWNPLTSTSAVGTLDMFSETINPNGIFVKDDLSRGYVIDAQQLLYEYVGDASASGGVSNWSLNHSVSLGSLGPAPLPRDIAIDPNGQLVYISSGFGGVFLYVMKIPWDLSSITYLKILDLSSDMSAIRGIHVVNPPSETLRLTVPLLNLSTTVQINDDYTPPSIFIPPPNLGCPYIGGYYMGLTCPGSQYYLIVSPSASGTNNSRQWKTTTTPTSFSNSCTNGFSNTYGALNNAEHPAGNWTATRTINGFSDWYLPSRDELATLDLNKGFLPTGENITNGTYWSSTGVGDSACSRCIRCPLSSLTYNQLSTTCNRVRAVRRDTGIISLCK